MTPVSKAIPRGVPSPLTQVPWQYAFQCDGCNGLSIGTFRNGRYESDWPTNQQDAEITFNLGRTDRKVDDWEPIALPSPDFPDVPEPIAASAREAHQCRAIGAYRSAAGTARAVVEATAKDRGITSGQIHEKIDRLVDQESLGELIRQQAHTIRHFGNDAMHGDAYVQPLGQAEIDEIVEIMDQILDRIYTAPAKLERLGERRNELRGNGQAAPGSTDSTG